MFDKEVIENIEKSRKKKEPIKIYFAHTLNSRDMVKENILYKFLNRQFKIINPFENRLDVLKDYKRNDSIQENLKITPTWILQHDLTLLNDCDLIIAYSPEKATYGVTFELVYCYLILKIPIFMIVHKEDLNHPHLTLMCSVLLEEKDFDSLIERIEIMFDV